MKTKQILLSALISLVFTSSAYAQANAQSVQQKIKKDFPSMNVTKVTFLPDVKLYEVRIKDTMSLSYTNENVDYFILNGKIIDPRKKLDVSQERDMNVIKDLVKGFPYDKAINVKYGNGERRVVVFSDPDCPYCKQADQQIANEMKNDNITFSYFMNPLDLPDHEQAPLKAKKIWCSPDKVTAWKNWMIKGILPDNPGTCKNPVDENKKLAESLDFTMTPIFIFDNGFIFRGGANPHQIRELLNMKSP